jgi:large subunit ribosomal protein L3
MFEESKRTGLIAQKIGMSHVFDEAGQAIPVTLLKADENFVLDVKTKEKNGYTAVVLGFGEKKPSRVNKSVKGLCAKAKVKPIAHMKEFRVASNALLQPGQKLSIEHFMLDQKIDIQGVNIGKGFAGGMKRHNFRGLEASHGVSVSHRSHGSTGNRQDPGRTFPGKKMAGHMGTETVTIQNIRVVAIDTELGIIAVNGSVPGKKGTFVYMKDAAKAVLPYGVVYPAAIVNSATTEAVVDNKSDNQPN